MQGVNKVMLIGHLGKDPEVFEISSDQKGKTLPMAVARITLATSESFNDNDGKKHTQTEWHNLVLWRGLADYAGKYLKKGNLVYVEGKLKTRQFEDKDGKKRYVTEVIADRISSLNTHAMAGAVAEPDMQQKDRDLPF